MENIDFASLEVIDATAKHKYSYSFDSENILMKLLLKSPISKSWSLRINKIIKLIHKLQKYYKTTVPIKIILIPTSLKKQLPKAQNQIIGVNECNSGATISYGKADKYIIIWRDEELEKVIIHEFIHYYGLDITGSLSLRDYNESYTEILATVWSAKNLKREYEHSMVVLAKLIKYWYGSYYPEITKKKPIPVDIKEKISEKTSVIGYYWIKAAMLYQIVKVRGGGKIDMKKISKKRYLRMARMAVRDVGWQKELKKNYEKIMKKKNVDRSLRMMAGE